MDLPMSHFGPNLFPRVCYGRAAQSLVDGVPSLACWAISTRNLKGWKKQPWNQPQQSSICVPWWKVFTFGNHDL